MKNSVEQNTTNKKEEGMLLGTLGASLLGNLLAVKDTIRAGEGTARAAQDF